MLTVDPGLAEADGGDAAGPPVPAQLPAVVGDFTGRHAEARIVEGWLDRATVAFGVVTALVLMWFAYPCFMERRHPMPRRDRAAGR